MGVDQRTWHQDYGDGTYLSQWDYDFPSEELIGALSALKLAPGSTALDLGCGAGRDAIYLAQQGFRTTAIDLSAQAIAIARQRGVEVRVDWITGNVLNIPLASRTFDLVTDRACFHHISTHDRPQYVQEVARVLKPGGALVLRGAREFRPDSFYEVTDQSIRLYFSERDFVIQPVYPIRIRNNAGGLSANMVTLFKK